VVLGGELGRRAWWRGMEPGAKRGRCLVWWPGGVLRASWAEVGRARPGACWSWRGEAGGGREWSWSGPTREQVGVEWAETGASRAGEWSWAAVGRDAELGGGWPAEDGSGSSGGGASWRVVERKRRGGAAACARERAVAGRGRRCKGASWGEQVSAEGRPRRCAAWAEKRLCGLARARSGAAELACAWAGRLCSWEAERRRVRQDGWR
jgi:hypothetical protein